MFQVPSQQQQIKTKFKMQLAFWPSCPILSLKYFDRTPLSTSPRGPSLSQTGKEKKEKIEEKNENLPAETKTKRQESKGKTKSDVRSLFQNDISFHQDIYSLVEILSSVDDISLGTLPLLNRTGQNSFWIFTSLSILIKLTRSNFQFYTTMVQYNWYTRFCLSFFISRFNSWRFEVLLHWRNEYFLKRKL